MRPRAFLLALLATGFALVLSAPAANAAGPFLLEIEASSGTGYGEVQCKVGSGPVEECEFEYESGTKLTLVPVPEAESEFAGFENGTGSASACTGIKACVFTIKADSYVEAPFDIAYRTIAIGFKGSGEGEISCEVEGGGPEGCEGEYLLGTELTLVPEAEAGSEFSGFQNGQGSASGCIGTSPCSFLLGANSSVEARFEPIRYVLSIVKGGTGTGSVACNGGACAPSYPEGSEVTLTATPAPGSAFTGFSGAGCSGTGSCTVWVEAGDMAVTASFEALPAPPPAFEGGTTVSQARQGMVRVSGIATVRGGRALLRLECEGGLCTGTLKLTMRVRLRKRARSVVIARAAFSLEDGADKTLRAKLSDTGVRALVGGRALRASAAGVGVAGRMIRLKPAF